MWRNSYIVKVNGGLNPAGYVQTGDPDATLDNATTGPVLLAPGDVYVNADFGYQPTGSSGSIGDRVWFDADADGVQDAGEAGIAGVTVALIRDLDGDGTWDAGEPIVATDVTDSGGLYGFAGLPIADGVGSDDYLVWVNDAESVLFGLDPTFDADGLSAPVSGFVSGANISAVQNLSSTPVTDQDFGYTAGGHSVGDGLLGDTIFIDRDNDGSPDAGEGREGVLVALYSSGGGSPLAYAYTDENGLYSFGGLDTDSDYAVTVVAANFLAGGPLEGLANTVDPDGGNDNTSDVLVFVDGVNLDQDFGYRPAAPNTIGGTIWEDRDADGSLEGGEANRFAGVTVLLVDTNGNVVGAALTDANGDYSFTGLPDGTYRVDVTDDANLLDGYWHSDGPNDDLDNNSQDDAYTVAVSGGQTNTTADFGYYRDPAAIGNFVWEDLDEDGIQDAGEPGMTGVVVTLTVSYPNGVTSTVVSVTDVSGYYAFGGLLLDEDHGDGIGDPSFTVSASRPASYLVTAIDQGGDDTVDADDPSGVIATPVQGITDNSFDFGFYGNTTLAFLVSFKAETRDGTVYVTWETAVEFGTIGFIVERRDSQTGEYAPIHNALIPGALFSAGAKAYAVPDAGAAPGGTYTYRLIEIENTGARRTYGPFTVTVDGEQADMLSWLENWFGDLSLSNLLAVAAADPDGDGLSNAQEFLAQTDPTDILSALKLVWAEIGLEGVTLEWSSSTGCLYDVEFSTNLSEGFDAVLNGIPATPPKNQITVPSMDGKSVFYRIRLAQ